VTRSKQRKGKEHTYWTVVYKALYHALTWAWFSSFT